MRSHQEDLPGNLYLVWRCSEVYESILQKLTLEKASFSQIRVQLLLVSRNQYPKTSPVAAVVAKHISSTGSLIEALSKPVLVEGLFQNITRNRTWGWLQLLSVESREMYIFSSVQAGKLRSKWLLGKRGKPVAAFLEVRVEVVSFRATGAEYPLGLTLLS